MEIGNPSVPVAVDGFVSNRAVALDLALFDVERIEVLVQPCARHAVAEARPAAW
ncbi:MAG: hypothetical protein U1F35_10015 [Steroidobacteraceae bacterium]